MMWDNHNTIFNTRRNIGVIITNIVWPKEVISSMSHHIIALLYTGGGGGSLMVVWVSMCVHKSDEKLCFSGPKRASPGTS